MELPQVILGDQPLIPIFSKSLRHASKSRRPDCIYFYSRDSRILHKTDFKTGQSTSYNLGSIVLEFGFVLTELNDKSIAITGKVSGNLSFRKLDMQRDLARTSMPHMIVPRISHSAAFYADYLNVIGGLSSGFQVKRCERFSLTRNCWEAIDPLCQPRYCLSTCVADGFLYVLGGGRLSSEALTMIESLN